MLVRSLQYNLDIIIWLSSFRKLIVDNLMRDAIDADDNSIGNLSKTD